MSCIVVLLYIIELIEGEDVKFIRTNRKCARSFTLETGCDGKSLEAVWF